MDTTQKDKWQIALDKELETLKQCQKTQSVPSCMGCNKIVECTIRENYVRVVYESMNKGSGGGFEF